MAISALLLIPPSQYAPINRHPNGMHPNLQYPGVTMRWVQIAYDTLLCFRESDCTLHQPSSSVGKSRSFNVR